MVMPSVLTTYKLLLYKRALKMLRSDICMTVIRQAMLEIFHFKVDIPRKVRELEFLLMLAQKVENNRIHDLISGL